MDEGRRHRPLSEFVRDRAVALSARELPLNFHSVPALRVTDVHEREIVLVGPEERNGAEPLNFLDGATLEVFNWRWQPLEDTRPRTRGGPGQSLGTPNLFST